MKWYFCLNEAGIVGFAECVVASAHSALQNTTLEPHLIFDGPPNQITEYLSSIGVIVHYHTNSFLNLIEGAKNQDGYSPSIARGAYLRFDIPVVDQSDDYVLYTDADVLFLSNPDLSQVKPELLAAAPEYALLDGKYKPYRKCFNSGVMVINLKKFREEIPGLLKFSQENDFYFHGNAGFYDQGALNHYFADRWDELPQSLNWRPFANSAESPSILHFHGTKPYEIACLTSGDSRPEKVRAVAKRMYDDSPGAYIMAIGVFSRFLPPAAVELIRNAAPAARGAMIGDRPDVLGPKSDLCSFFFGGKRIAASAFYDRPYLNEFAQILEKYLGAQPSVNILEWGSGFTTLLTVSVLDRWGVNFSIDSLDNFDKYQNALKNWLYAGNRVNFILADTTGPGRSQRDPELNYSTLPLNNVGKYDFIFIDGRRRVECAYIAALIAKPDTIIVIHDFRRGRYQPVLGLFDVIEETEQFRVMRVRKAVAKALNVQAVLGAIRPGL